MSLPYMTQNILQILSTSCFAVCGHHPSLGISFVFSFYCLVHPTISCHLRSRSAFFPRLARLVLPCMVDILPLYELCSHLLCHRGNFMRLPSLPLEYRYFLFLLSARYRSPTQNRNFSRRPLSHADTFSSPLLTACKSWGEGGVDLREVSVLFYNT